MNNRWLLLVALVLACAFCSTGCKRRQGGLRPGEFGVDPVTGMAGGGDMYAAGWQSDRPENMTFLPDVRFENVLFEYDSTQVASSERAKIEAVADYIRSNQRVGVVVEGHCDERGSREYNMALGERRALAVRAYLIGLGIDGAVIQTKSYGKENPIAFGSDESAWLLNRRAEFVFYNY
ncbi:MAG: OmpA family protein [Kiritimatiellia bacterium]|nr:OmpA family protein [Lentisphaerota bacterium]